MDDKERKESRNVIKNSEGIEQQVEEFSKRSGEVVNAIVNFINESSNVYTDSPALICHALCRVMAIAMYNTKSPVIEEMSIGTIRHKFRELQCGKEES